MPTCLKIFLIYITYGYGEKFPLCSPVSRALQRVLFKARVYRQRVFVCRCACSDVGLIFPYHKVRWTSNAHLYSSKKKILFII